MPHRAALGTAPTHELPAEHEVAETQGQAWFQSAADVVRAIMQQIENGVYRAAILGTPCNSFCVARFRNDGGARPLRSRNDIMGLPNLNPEC